MTHALKSALTSEASDQRADLLAEATPAIHRPFRRAARARARARGRERFSFNISCLFGFKTPAPFYLPAALPAEPDVLFSSRANKRLDSERARAALKLTMPVCLRSRRANDLHISRILQRLSSKSPSRRSGLENGINQGAFARR